MEQLFHANDAYPAGKRPAEAEDDFGGESKRFCIEPWAEPLDFNLLQDWSWIDGAALLGSGDAISSPNAVPVPAPWAASQYPNHYYDSSYSWMNTDIASVPSSESWSVFPNYGVGACTSEPILPIPTVSSAVSYSRLSSFKLEDAFSESRALSESLGDPATDATATNLVGSTIFEDFTTHANQSVLAFDDPFPGRDCDVLLNLKTEEAAIGITAETHSPSPLDATEPEANSGMETTSTTALSVPTPEQKRPDSTQCDNLPQIDARGHDGFQAAVEYDACFGVVSSEDIAGLRRD